MEDDRLRQEAVKKHVTKKKKSEKAEGFSTQEEASGEKSKTGPGQHVQEKNSEHQDPAEAVSYGRRGLGARSGGQAGDTQGISARVGVDSESVEELLAEGQSFEAEVVNGVENAPDPDQGEVRTRQLPEDDVPEEYREQD